MLRASSHQKTSLTTNCFGLGIRADVVNPSLLFVGHGSLQDPCLDEGCLDLARLSYSQPSDWIYPVQLQVEPERGRFNLSIRIDPQLTQWPVSWEHCLEYSELVARAYPVLEKYHQALTKLRTSWFLERVIPTPHPDHFTDIICSGKSGVITWKELPADEAARFVVILAMITEGMAIKAAQHELPDRGG